MKTIKYLFIATAIILSTIPIKSQDTIYIDWKNLKNMD